MNFLITGGIIPQRMKTVNIFKPISYCVMLNQNTGLELYLDYHDPDDGDMYDEVNGVMWCVDGVYQLTEAGKIHHKQIQRKGWVSFG